MIKNILVLADGTEITSGSREKNAIVSTRLDSCSNAAAELEPGSVCAAVLEVDLFTPGGALEITTGQEVTLFRQDDSGKRSKVGVFILQKPTRPTANSMALTGYDRVTKLDKDLTGWLDGLTGWPYTLIEFANMVCEACGINLSPDNIRNAGFLVDRFSYPGVTGRKIMQWIAQISGAFGKATPDGDFAFAWYRNTDITLNASGSSYFFSGTLEYETFTVAPVDAVQLRLTDSKEGYLWPEADEGANCYVIYDNPLLSKTDSTKAVLESIKAVLNTVIYTPCKVSFPTSISVQTGDVITVVDRNGKRLSVPVMNLTVEGTKQTAESTGSVRRDTSENTTQKTPEQEAADHKNTANDAAGNAQTNAENFASNVAGAAQNNAQQYADGAAQNAVNNQSQKDVVDKLTGGNANQALFLRDGKIYINADFIVAGSISSDIIKAGVIRSQDYAEVEVEMIYPGDDVFPSDTLYPNNGGNITRGIEIDFSAGVIRGVFFSDQLEEIDNRLTALEKIVLP